MVTQKVIGKFTRCATVHKHVTVGVMGMTGLFVFVAWYFDGHKLVEFIGLWFMEQVNGVMLHKGEKGEKPGELPKPVDPVDPDIGQNI